MSFYCFPKLPKELQLMVWEAALSDPQVITICDKKYCNRTDDELLGADKRLWPFMSSGVASDADLVTCGEASIIKSLYFACKESQAIVKRTYGLYFKNQLSRTIFFNNSFDTLYFSDCDAIESFTNRGRQSPISDGDSGVKNLATIMPFGKQTDIGDYHTRQNDWVNIFMLIRQFSEVERVLFVDRSPKPDKWHMEYLCEEFDDCTKMSYFPECFEEVRAEMQKGVKFHGVEVASWAP